MHNHFTIIATISKVAVTSPYRATLHGTVLVGDEVPGSRVRPSLDLAGPQPRFDPPHPPPLLGR